MKRRRHTPEQIIRKLAEGEKLAGQGQSIEEVARHLEITESTPHRWRNQYGGMKATDATPVKELEKENQRLTRIVADQARDIDTVRGVEPGKLLTPERRRAAVGLLEERVGGSERRACRVVGQTRSTQRLPAPVPSDDELALRAWLRDFARRRPRWGWRRAAVEAKKAGWRANHTRIHRLWIKEGLPTARQEAHEAAAGHREARGGGLPDPTQRGVGHRLPQLDQTFDGKMLKILNVVDEFTREALACDVERSIDADGVVRCVDRLAKERGAPVYVRFDNDP